MTDVGVQAVVLPAFEMSEDAVEHVQDREDPVPVFASIPALVEFEAKEACAGHGRRPLAMAKPISASRISCRLFWLSALYRRSCWAENGINMPPIKSATMTSTTASSVRVKPSDGLRKCCLINLLAANRCGSLEFGGANADYCIYRWATSIKHGLAGVLESGWGDASH